MTCLLACRFFRAVYTGTRPGLTPAIRAGKGGGDAGSLLPGVLPPELGALVRVEGQTPSCNKSLSFFLPLGMLVATWVPTHATMMHIRWAPLIGHLGGKAGKSTVGPHFPPFLDVSFW